MYIGKEKLYGTETFGGGWSDPTALMPTAVHTLYFKLLENLVLCKVCFEEKLKYFLFLVYEKKAKVNYVLFSWAGVNTTWFHGFQIFAELSVGFFLASMVANIVCNVNKTKSKVVSAILHAITGVVRFITKIFAGYDWSFFRGVAKSGSKALSPPPDLERRQKFGRKMWILGYSR